VEIANLRSAVAQVEAEESELDPVALRRKPAAERLDADMRMPREALPQQIVVRLKPTQTRVHLCLSVLGGRAPHAPRATPVLFDGGDLSGFDFLQESRADGKSM
jgi:hypothetical protein